jgi:hypothetical protein
MLIRCCQQAWNDGRIIALFVVFGVLLIAWLTTQWWMGDKATVPFRIIGKRSVWASVIFGFMHGGAMFTVIYFLPIWFQAVKGASAVSSGIRTLPLMLSVTVFSMSTGLMVTKIGYYTPFMIAGPIVRTIGLGLLTTFQPGTSAGEWIGYQILIGSGIGLGAQLPMIAVQVRSSEFFAQLRPQTEREH